MNDQILTSGTFNQIKTVVHGFGTRYMKGYPDGFQVATLEQIHSNNVFIVKSPGIQGKGDAMITNVPGIVLAVKTADCVPVLVYDEHKRIAGAIHSGWRGIYNGVVERFFEICAKELGSSPGEIKTAIGPCIELKCYEVKDDVVKLFQEKFSWWNKVIVFHNKKRFLNLRLAVQIQLIESGIDIKNIEHIDLCTYCRHDLFYSFRRDGNKTGRMFSYIGLTQ
jgi:YfiH family protein